MNKPILFLIFNRPEHTLRVFEQIRLAKPRKFYIASDGPRPNNIKDEFLVNQSRKIIEKIDWECEYKTLFRSDNLGCRIAVSEAINWFFNNEPEGIILEDDCFPSDSFFTFCDEMLDYYRENKSIGIISGSNLFNSKKIKNQDYFFSKYVHIWGWATWSDRWKSYYDPDMTSWPSIKQNKDKKWLYGDDFELNYWVNIFDRTYRKEIDTWDYQWVFANWISNRINIIPRVNLISNIGFGQNATHTLRKNSLSNLPIMELTSPIRHPKLIIRNIGLDNFHYKKHLSQNLFKRIIKKIIGK